MSHEARVLDVFEPNVWRLQADILREVGMDASTCISTLKRLAGEGVLEFGQVERSGIRGRRRHIYRLAMRVAA